VGDGSGDTICGCSCGGVRAAAMYRKGKGEGARVGPVTEPEDDATDPDTHSEFMWMHSY
jgi:hypothetical protein